MYMVELFHISLPFIPFSIFNFVSSIFSQHTWRTSPIFRLCKPLSARFFIIVILLMIT